MAVATLFGAILVFTDLSVVYVLTRGGPVDATQILPTWAFFRGIQGGDLAQGAAVALFLFPRAAGHGRPHPPGRPPHGDDVTRRPQR